MRVKRLFAFLCLYSMIIGVWGSPVVLNPDAPPRYVVGRSDAVWNIAARFLRDPWQWPQVWHPPVSLKDPHLIYPGDIISLNYREEGQPSLTLQRGFPVYKISPKTHVIKLEKPVPAIPTEIIRPFLVYPQIVSKETLENAPYVVAGADERLILGAGDEAYVRGIIDTTATRYGLYRKGDVYRDSEHPDKILGYEARFIADVKIMQRGELTTVYIKNSTREVLVGDLLLPIANQEFEAYFFPHTMPTPVEGKIMAVIGGVSQIGQHQVVVLNLGAENGIEKGIVLGVYQAGREVRDTVSSQSKILVQLPDERAGAVMVFRVFDRLSYALVMRAQRAIHIYDAVRNP